ncbi:MAG TPA: hypothetical protein VLB67_09010 [Acidimicrobiia bacterium]|nr:hypothetical protein [Acidimicrobiia bacterium]
MIRMRGDRRSLPHIVLLLALVVLAIVLLWHLFGMEHSEGMGILGGCLFLVTVALVLVVPTIRWPLRVPVEARREGPPKAALHPVSRPPPIEASLASVVLIE